jgi:glycosyltransferase involved in cell wall biosynthesis
MTLRVGIEAHVVNSRASGNGRVVGNLIAALHRVSDHQLFAYFTDPATADAWRRRGLHRLTIRLVRPRHPLVRIPLGLPLMAARDRLDVFLAHDNRPPVAPCPVVTLVHDVAFARFPELFPAFERTWMRRTIPASMRRSRRVVTVSEFTKAEITELYGVPADRITVAHNGVDPIFLEPTRRDPVVSPPYFLAVGNLQPRKNLSTLVSAYRRLIEGDPTIAERLVIVGQRSYASDALFRDSEDLVARGRILFTGYVPDEALVGLLQHATAFAYPSVYEGFGLPPLEAMATGAPTLVADIPVMREVVAEAAARLAPTDVAAWEEALRRVAREPSLRERLGRSGRERAARFTWDASASVVAQALEEAAGGRSGGVRSRALGPEREG